MARLDEPSPASSRGADGPAERSAGVPARLLALFGALDGAGLRWCLLRPREGLAHPDGDVDVLLEPSGLAAAHDVLAAQAFVVLHADGSDVHAADFDREAGRFLWIHLQTTLRVAGAAVPAGEVLATVAREQLPQPPDTWMVWILLLRGLLEKGDIPARHRGYLARAAPSAPARPPGPLARVAGAAGLDPAAVLELARDERWTELLRLAVPGRSGSPTLRRRLRALPARLAELRRRPGLTVAVIGPDGAGKTTLVGGLAASLPLPTRVQYMGLTGGHMPRADRLRIPGLVFAARVAILWSRYGRGAYHRARGRVVLFDRYALDGAVPSGASPGPLGRLSRRLQRRACPLPDLVLFLDATGETMHRRSGEYDPERLEDWRRAYARLRGSVPGLAVLDAERPAETVLRDAQVRVWERYARR